MTVTEPAAGGYLELPWDRLEALAAGPDPDRAAKLRRSMSRRGIRDRSLYLPNLRHPLADPDAFRTLLDGFEHPASGLRTVVPAEDPDYRGQPNPHFHKGWLTLHLDIYDGGRPVGIGNYDLDLRDDGTVFVRVCNLRLRQNQETDPQARYRYMGRGFGAALHAHLEQGLRSNGVDQLELSAVGTGGYVWARFGFLFDPRDPRFTGLPTVRQRTEAAARNLIQRAAEESHFLRRSRTIPASLERQVKALAQAPQIPLTPEEIGQLGRDFPYYDAEGQLTWLGREILTRHTYSAVKFL